MKVLVTGSSGRLGYYVVRALQRAGHDVTLFDQRRPPEEYRSLPWIEGNTTDFEDCRRALRGGFDAVQHLAALPYPSDHPETRHLNAEQGVSFDTTMRSNMLGTYYMLQAAVAEGVKTFVMTSSNCALGNAFRISKRPFPYRYFPVDEAHPSDIEDTYSFTKLAGEQLLASYTRAYDMRTYAVRPAAIFDENARRETARQARPADSLSPVLWAWVGVEDVASAHQLVMEQADRLPPHDVFFCNANDTTALEPSQELLERFAPHLLPLAKDIEGHASFLGNRKLREAVGWQHRTSWREHRNGKAISSSSVR